MMKFDGVCLQNLLKEKFLISTIFLRFLQSVLSCSGTMRLIRSTTSGGPIRVIITLQKLIQKKPKCETKKGALPGSGKRKSSLAKMNPNRTGFSAI